MSRRGQVGIAVLLLWVAGLALLVRRELFRDSTERFAEAALRVAPGAVYFAVMHEDEPIGFASMTIDTSASAITVSDYLVSDVPVGRSYHRATASTTVRLTRALRLSTFELTGESSTGPLRVTGAVNGDSVLALAIKSGVEPADSQRVALDGPVLLPTLVPLAALLGAEPHVGKKYTLPVFDPLAMQSGNRNYRIEAESLFVIADSAQWDSASGRWTTALEDTVRAWHLVPTDSVGVSTWVDAQGRVVEARLTGGFQLRRMAYELAFENWRLRARERPEKPTADRDILESTAIAADAPIDKAALRRLAVRLRDVSLAGFDLAGERQELRGDTLIITRESRSALRAPYSLASPPRSLFPGELSATPLIQSRHPSIVALAKRIAAGERDPIVVAERLARWVHDSLDKEIAVGVPSAIQVLRTRRGDCNEHTQLYLALARAAGIPARSVAGLALVRGRFYYHAWPEVFLGRWVAVDPTFDQFPADAAHLRFITGGLARQAELLRLIGALRIDVLDQQAERTAD